MKVALDSNLLLYLAFVWKVDEDRVKTARRQEMLLRFSTSPEAFPVVPMQALGEAYNVMRHYGYAPDQCRSIVLDLAGRFEAVPSGETAYFSAVDLAADHRLQFWDALIVNVAADAGCKLLLSEDMQSGFVWRGLTIVNPFAVPMDERLARLLDAPQ